VNYEIYLAMSYAFVTYVHTKDIVREDYLWQVARIVPELALFHPDIWNTPIQGDFFTGYHVHA
jgi:hypothetical protein